MEAIFIDDVELIHQHEDLKTKLMELITQITNNVRFSPPKLILAIREDSLSVTERLFLNRITPANISLPKIAIREIISTMKASGKSGYST